jgi:hypothetical protein
MQDEQYPEPLAGKLEPFDEALERMKDLEWQAYLARHPSSDVRWRAFLALHPELTSSS